jgi:hypothetical protein
MSKERRLIKTEVWAIFNPETGMYYKRAPNGKHHLWKREPYIFTSEKHLMRNLDILRKYWPKAQVVPYALAANLITDVEHYGV